MSCYAIFESNAPMYRIVLKYSSLRFVRHFFVFYLHYPQNESMSVLLRAHRDLLFSLHFSVFEPCLVVWKEVALEKRVVKTDKHTVCAVHP